MLQTRAVPGAAPLHRLLRPAPPGQEEGRRAAVREAPRSLPATVGTPLPACGRMTWPGGPEVASQVGVSGGARAGSAAGPAACAGTRRPEMAAPGLLLLRAAAALLLLCLPPRARADEHEHTVRRARAGARPVRAAEGRRYPGRAGGGGSRLAGRGWVGGRAGRAARTAAIAVRNRELYREPRRVAAVRAALSGRPGKAGTGVLRAFPVPPAAWQPRVLPPCPGAGARQACRRVCAAPGPSSRQGAELGTRTGGRGGSARAPPPQRFSKAPPASRGR